MIDGVVSVAAGLLGFLDYLVPTATQNVCIDVEEGISDLYIAGLALLDGILAIHGHMSACASVGALATLERYCSITSESVSLSRLASFLRIS
jgi:hypothetical protein